jgi:3-oxoacyl-[acyl-carrier-protein] synthase II
MREVVVTGIGPVLPGCRDRRTLWQQLRAGQSQLRLEPDPSSPDRRCPMGRVDDLENDEALAELPDRARKRRPREQLLYLASLERARVDAALALERIERDRIGLWDGTSRSNLEFWYDTAREGAPYTRKAVTIGLPGFAVHVAASVFGVEGPTYTFTGTCASGAIAIGHAVRAIQAGDVDIAFATGHDAPLLRPIYEMYTDAGVLSKDEADPTAAVRPFSEHTGNALSEGAVTLVLEERAHAIRRGAPILARINGYRYGNNGTHPTDVDQSGLRAARLITALLADSRAPAETIGFVVGHGNGVPMSDASELAYMRRIFGSRTREVPLISVKPIFGHPMGASPAVSAAAAVLMLHHGEVVPTINLNGHENEGFDHVTRARATSARSGLVISYGMGGQNAVLLFGKESAS